MEIKDLIDSIIHDLTDDAPISRIMLKAQAIASNLNNPDFSAWVKREQNGYVSRDTIPEYRRCACSAKVNLTQGFKVITNFDVPIDAIPDKTAREMLSYAYFANPISEIEAMASNVGQDALLKEVAPSYAYTKVGEIFPYANVDMLWKLINVSSTLGIVDKVKSKMLDFFLELDKQTKLGIDFNQLEGKKEIAQVLNQTINAGIYHSGKGDIIATGSNIGKSVSGLDVDSLKDLIGKIRESRAFDGDEDAQEELSAIDIELEQTKPDKKFLRKSLLFLGGLASNIGASVAGQYISQALGIL